MKIFYTHKAIQDLEPLYEFIAQHNPPAAINAKEKILQAITRLINFPLLGKTVDHQETATPIRDLITGNYLIRYLILKEELHILRIWYGKENRFLV